MFTATIIFVFAITFVSCANNAPRIKTAMGEIQGHYLVSYEGNKYKAFEGIPYALPPIGQRRFKDPERVQPWNGTLIANKFKTVCLGLVSVINIDPDRPIPKDGYIVGTEDCLYLNVYVPMNVTGKLPVVHYIYGGAFRFSSLTGSEQQYLIDRNVIFVSFNYRQGTLGFLSTEDDVVPGNMGLKDQALALRWVSENIEHFGGDPKEITLYGWSSGAVIVHLNYLSPMTAGLFKSGVSFSGTAMNSWAQAKESRAKAIELGRMMDCPTDDIPQMIECLRTQSAENITITESKFMPWQLTPPVPLGPVVEKNSSNSFIDRRPIDIIRNGDFYHAPWITGVTSEDGLVPVAAFALNDTILKDLDENWDSIAPYLLDYYYSVPIEEHANVACKIRQHYFGNATISKENILTLTHLVGDRWFAYNSVEAIKEHAKASSAPIRWYIYDYRATDSVSNNLSNSTKNFGVCHGDDVMMVLGNSFINPTKTTEDFEMHTELLNFWLSVVHTSEPDFPVKWTPISKTNDDFEYLRIAGPEDFRMEKNNDVANLQFWESLGFNENKVCV